MTACSFCYKVDSCSACGKCKKRLYCSKECQTKDWKCGHKHWCSVAGELGFDFEVKDTGVLNKGLGLYALRDFKRNDKILVERPAMTSVNDATILAVENKGLYDAVMALEPLSSTDIRVKFDVNSMRCSCVGDDKEGLFINLSRTNHHCLGNSHHTYNERHNLKMLIATADIARGEEITFPYTNGTAASRPTKEGTWGFDCHCSCCSDPEKAAMWEEIAQLDDLTYEQCHKGQTSQAIVAAKRIITLFDQLRNIPSGQYSRTYNDLVSLCVLNSSTLEEAKIYARLCYEAECDTYSGCADQARCGSVQRCKEDMENISRHPNYLRG